jgi:hypothetical protein
VKGRPLTRGEWKRLAEHRGIVSLTSWTAEDGSFFMVGDRVEVQTQTDGPWRPGFLKAINSGPGPGFTVVMPIVTLTDVKPRFTLGCHFAMIRVPQRPATPGRDETAQRPTA